MVDTQRSEISLQRSLLVGLGYEGARLCLTLYRRLQEMLGWHPPVIRYLIIANTEESKLLREHAPDFREAETNGVFRVLLAESGLRQPMAGAENGERGAALRWLLSAARPLEEHLHELSSYIGRAEHKALLQQRGLDVLASPRSTYYLLGSIANPFTSGIFIDLAYLIADFNRIPSEDLETQQHLSFINGILFLPGLADDFQAAPARIEDEQQIALRQVFGGRPWRWVAGNAYAALKELHYYMSGHVYQSPTYTTGNKIEFDASAIPFQDGLCFLVSHENEQGDVGMSVNDAIYLVADWLIHRLAGAASGAFQTIAAGPGGGFAGLGLYAWVLPRRELVTYCTSRLLSELFHNVLLAPQGSSAVTMTLRRSDLGLSEQMVRNALQNPRNWPPPQLRYQERVGSQLSITAPLLDVGLCEVQLLRADDTHRRQLDEVRNTTVALLGRLVEQTISEMRNQASRFLDANPYGGLAAAIYVFRELRDAFSAEHQTLEAQYKRDQNERNQLARDIQRQRARYIYAVRALGVFKTGNFLVPSIPVLILGAFSLLPLLLWLLLSSNVQDTTLALATSGLSIAFSSLLIYVWYRYAQTTRNELEGRYAERQQLDLKVERQEGFVYVWSEVSHYCDAVLQDLNYLRDLLQKMADESAEQHSNTEFQARLYESPRHAHERSVLTPTIVQEFYQQITFADRQDQINDLMRRINQPYHTWVNDTAEALYQRIEQYIQQRIQDAGQFNVIDLLERKYADQELARMLQTGFGLAMPTLNVGTYRLPESSRLQILTHYRQEETRSKTWQFITEIAQRYNHHFVISADRDALAHLTLRDSVPLYTIQSVRNLYREYDHLRTEGRLEWLHPQKERMMFADIAPTSDAVQDTSQPVRSLPLELMIKDHRDLFVLAGFLKMIEYDDDQELYRFGYINELEAWLETAGGRVEPTYITIGKNKEDAVAYFYTHKNHFNLLLSDIRNEVKRKIAVDYSDHETLLARDLYEYGRQHKAILAAWEEEVITNFLRLIKERNPLAAAQERRVRSGAPGAALNITTDTQPLSPIEQESYGEPLGGARVKEEAQQRPRTFSATQPVGRRSN